MLDLTFANEQIDFMERFIAALLAPEEDPEPSEDDLEEGEG